jgi:hypothetical protein
MQLGSFSVELGQAAKNIQAIIAEIGKCRREIEDKGKARAGAIKIYDMRLAIALAELRNAETYELNSKTYKVPPVSIAEKIAKGMVAHEREAMELAESGYKACISNLEALKAQLNGYQSIFRHME